MFFGKKAKEKDVPVSPSRLSSGIAEVLAEPEKAPVAANKLAVSAELTDAEAKQLMEAARHASATFGEIVTLLMRTPEYKSLSLGDLDQLIIPALRVGQVSVATAQSKTSGVTAPVGAIAWACVSDDVAKRLASQAGEPIRISPEEWKSGDIVWVVASAGEGRVLSEMLKQLSRREWAGREVRIVVRPKDGKPAVATLAVQSPQAA
jgi:hemolysin-activating ACP:hemolysin acyltransferase